MESSPWKLSPENRYRSLIYDPVPLLLVFIPLFLFDPSPVFFLPPYLSLSFFPLLFDCVSRIASWPFVRYRDLLRASLRSPIFLRSLLEYRWPNSHETSHCRINWNCQPNSRTIFFLSFRKFPPRDSSNNFVTRVLSDLNSCWKSIVLIIIHCYSYS